MKIERPQSKQPLPEGAKKVFEGVIFDVYQWEQEMFDGTKATFEKLKRPDTVITFPVLEDGRILLTKQEQPGGKGHFIAGAGGRVDPGEDILDAAKRELLEETGYEAEEFVLWKSLQPIGKIEWAVYVFVAKRIKKVAEINADSGEKIELYPVTFDEFMEIALGENFYEKEVHEDVFMATFDEQKRNELKKMLSN